MTKGQCEAEISKAITKFEREYMGRGPIRINTSIFEDVVFVRLWGFLTPAERRVSQTNEGTELIKNVRIRLFEEADIEFRKVINEIIPDEILSIHSDVSTKTGEKIIVITFKNVLKI